MGCGPYYQQVNTIDQALRTLRGVGLGPGDNAFNILRAERSKLLRQIGIKFPRSINQLVRLAGFSPGVIALWHDNENGFMVEARTDPGAPPVYHLVQGDIAMKVLSHDISPELEEFLMKEEIDIDN